MEEVLDDSLLRAEEKPHVHFGILLLLLGIILITILLQDYFNTNVTAAFGISAIGSLFPWSFAMFKRCKRNKIVLLFIVLSIIAHIDFIIEVLWAELKPSFILDFTKLDYGLLRVLIYFYIIPFALYFVFMKMKLREYKPLFKKKD